MTKKRNNVPIYLIFAVITLLFVMAIAGNLAFYRAENLLDAMTHALNDLTVGIIHCGTDEYYRTYYFRAFIGYVILVTAFFINEEKYRHDAGGIEAGSAKWESNIREYNKKYNEPFHKASSDSSNNMILSEHVRLSLNDLATHRNNNVMIWGAAGTGKSRFVLKPNLLQQNCSYVIADPSGEMLRDLGKEFMDSGYVVKVFNLVNMGYSNFYNPFRYIREDKDVGVIVDCFISNTTPPEENKGDPFWEKSEKALLTACIYYLKDFCVADEQNFSMVLKMIVLAQLDENARVTTNSKLDNLFEGKACIKDGEYFEIKNSDEQKTMTLKIKNSLAWKNYQVFKLGGVRTLKSILISAAVRLNPFNVPAVANLTCKDTISLDEIGDKKTILFLIIPQANTTYNFLVSMMYSQMFDSLYYKSEQNKGDQASPDSENEVVRAGRLPVHVRFLMDEWANTGKIPNFDKIISTCRKYNISITVVLQSLAQIQEMYKDSYETIIGNCDSLIMLGTNEQTTAEYITKQLGKATIRARSAGINRGSRRSSSLNYQQVGRELMTPDEIRGMNNDDCIVLVRGVRPFFDKKFKYENHPRYSYTGDADKSRRFDITCEDRFRNFRSQKYDEMAVESEDPDEAEASVSKPVNVTDVKVGEQFDSLNIKQKVECISDVDKRATVDYLMKARILVDEEIRKELKSKVICINVPVDHRVVPSFVQMTYSKYHKPVIIFCRDFKEGFIRGYFIEANELIRNSLESYTHNRIHIENDNDFDDNPIFVVDGIRLEDYPFIKSSLLRGITLKEDMAEHIDEIYDRFHITS